MTRTPPPGVVPGLVLAAVLAFVNLLGWQAMNRPLEAPDAVPKFAGLAYNAFQRWDSPITRRYPGDAAIAADLDLLAGMTRRIRTYSSAEFAALPALAGERELKVTAGAWLDGRPAEDAREIEALKESARTHRSIERLIVGNETILHGALGVDELIAHLNDVRRAVRVPVSTAEPWHVWLRYPELARHVDYITVHLLPYWEGVPSDRAVDYAMERYAQLKARFPGKHVVIGEIGWPSRGDRWTYRGSTATASPGEQAVFMREFMARVRGKPVDYFVMEAIDQPWKASNEGRVGAYWGLLHADRTEKFAWSGPVQRNPNWELEAFAASLLGFVAVAWFATRFTRLRAPSRIVYGAVLQATAGFVVWLLAEPVYHYLRPGDVVALALLLPPLALMVAIVVSNGFEFVEVFWRGNLKRTFGPRPLRIGAREPMVSIHLAACNEPPEMVIATLETLRRLRYQNLEVLVVDNNTRDEALWMPVRDWIERTGDSRLRFFHLPSWPGFKAGALNFALGQTSPDAEIVGVVDADYVVDPDWLRVLVAHFDDPRIAVVQTPQAHRGWAGHWFRRMMNWEYDGFFRIGMHHRNERDAIIQHGTMTLIRAAALREHGRWSEWCICEDAELGLRLMKAGLSTVYVDRVMGRGLTPDGFAAFKRQRERWALGAMQILKAHARTLFARGGPLTAGQRYHFVAGWLPWIGDALHLVFTLGAMAWTIVLVSSDSLGRYPLAMYLVPLIVGFVVRALLGPLLYWRRVRCGPGETVGAALAGMSLSHAIARGVFAGLVRRGAVFQVTAKGGRATRADGLAAAREEALMLAGLLVCASAVATSRMPGHLESALWIGVLLLQALPYAAAVVCAWLSGRPESGRPLTAPTVAARASASAAAAAVSVAAAPAAPLGALVPAPVPAGAR